MFKQQNSNLIIYLAEDDQDDRALFLEALGKVKDQYTVRISENGKELLTMLQVATGDKPQILFLDINMPLKNGFDCLKEIRSNRCYDTIKIIMFSTSSSRIDIELSYKLGADFYAVKPHSYPELEEFLGDVMTIEWDTVIRSKAEFILLGKKAKML